MSQASWVGKNISGRYKIDELIGQGGMSAVYKATDPNLRRVVAVKMIHAHLSTDPDFVRRFEEEAAAVAGLRHPNIVQVFDFNHDDEIYYMVLEFVPGETLQDYLKRLHNADRRLPLKQAIEFAASICDAVDYAHQRGLIHRDIKPANVMVNVQGQAILMDFGIAKIVGGQQHTATGAVLGTAMYMSPEQIKGEHPDRRTDIYSLGVTLFEMVGGRPPYEADSAMTLMMMHVNDPIPDLRQLNPEVPDDLVGIIQKALAKDPADRFQTAAQMAAALRNVLARLTATPQAVTPPGATMVEPPQPEAAPSGATVIEAPGAVGMALESTMVEPASTHGIASSTSSAPAGTAVETPPWPPESRSATSIEAAPPKKRGLPVPLIAGGVIALLALVCLIGGGYLVYNQFFAGGGAPLSQAGETPAVALLGDAQEPTETLPPTPTFTPGPPTETPLPTDTPTQTLTPTPTVPVGIPFSRINNITIDDQNRYVVDYETFEFTEVLPGMHVHFFFDTVPPEQAGNPGSGPWYLWGGPRPFNGYRVSDRPQAATQMCILVANPDHSVQANSGNCFDLTGQVAQTQPAANLSAPALAATTSKPPASEPPAPEPPTPEPPTPEPQATAASPGYP